VTRNDSLPVGLHVFTANMTGNVVFLAFGVAGAPGVSVARSLTSLGAFLIGAAAGGRLGLSMAAASRRRWLLTVAMSESGLLFAAALVSIGVDVGSVPPGRLYAVIVLTALAMGLRNATVRQLAVPDLTTTVLTLTLTALASESSLAGGTNPRIRAVWRRSRGCCSARPSGPCSCGSGPPCRSR